MGNRRMCFRRLGHFVAGVLGIFYFGVDTIEKLQILTKTFLAKWRKIWYILYEICFALPA